MREGTDYPEISVVIPCYNSEKTIVELHERLIKTLDSFSVSYEIVYVNDDSKDSTASFLKTFAQENENVTVVDLMFNVGQFRALLCGMEYSNGSYVVTMDDDLQHPPEEISKLYYEIKNNDEADIVIGKYLKKSHSLFRNIGSYFIHKLSKKNNNNIRTTSFRCMRRKLVEALLMHKTMFPLMGTLIRKSTNRIVNVDVEHRERKEGKSNYFLTKLIGTTLDRIFNYTSFPLKFISCTGIIISCISFILALYYLINYFIGKITMPGWTTVVLLINFYSGLLLLSIAIIGEYIIRILNEVSGNPRYVIRNIYRHTTDAAN